MHLERSMVTRKTARSAYAGWFVAAACLGPALIGLTGCGSMGPPTVRADQATLPPDTRARASETFGRLPLSFEANLGQAPPEVKFLSRGSGHTLFLTTTGAVMVLRPPVDRDVARAGGARRAPSVRMTFLGADPAARVEGRDEVPGTSSYFTGRDPGQWRTGVRHHGSVRYHDVYPGIDVVFHGKQRQLEFDLVVAPGADPRAIRLGFDGLESLRVDERGDLVLVTGGTEIRMPRPFVYQEIDGVRKEAAGDYVMVQGSTGGASQRRAVAFHVDGYDSNRPLVIDPVLVYSSYLGGSVLDIGQAIAVDGSGQAYITGITSSPDFPVTPSAFDTECGTDGLCNFEPPAGPIHFDVFVTKLSSDGSSLVYSVFLGGRGDENNVQSTSGIAVDASGNAYVTGSTASTDFPTTAGAFQTSCLGAQGGGCTFGAGFVAKISPDGGSLVYSTYLSGGSNGLTASLTEARGIAVDALGRAHVTGTTTSASFPVTPGAAQSAFGGAEHAFVTKLNASGSGLVYSTSLGGNGQDQGLAIALDALGNAYVTGATTSTNFPTTPGAFQPACAATTSLCDDAFVVKLNPTGSALMYATYLGGGTNFERPLGIAVDAGGNAIVTGQTKSTDFPTVNAIRGASGSVDTFGDGFVTKLNPTGTAAVYSTYLGGGFSDVGFGVAVDSAGNAYVTGFTNSPDFPIADAWQASPGPNDDAFVTKLAPDGTLVSSTFFGGAANDEGHAIAVDVVGNVYITGLTTSMDFPTASPVQPFIAASLTAFVAKFGVTTVTADLSISGRASLSGQASQSGTEITYTVSVTNHGPDPASSVQLDDLMPLQSTLVSVTPTRGTCVAGAERVTCAIGTLARAQSAAVTIVINQNLNATPSVNLVRVASGAATDPDMSNNSVALDFHDFVRRLEVSVPLIASGSVVSSPPGIDCPQTCSATFDDGTVVTLTVTPSSQFVFSRWGGDCSGSGACVITLTRNAIVTPEFVTLSPQETFISRFYSDVLGRAPDPNGMTAWIGFLQTRCGPAGLDAIARGFFDSAEFRMTRPHTLQNLVRTLYLVFLGREPDAAGEAAWANVIRLARLTVAVNGFIGSPEFLALLPDRTNRTAVAATVTRFYQEALGRQPEPAGLAAWVNYIATTHDLERAVLGFLTAPEFEARPLTSRDYVAILYRMLLGRSPDVAGLDAWEKVLRDNLLQIINGGFVPSPEFQGKLLGLCR